MRLLVTLLVVVIWAPTAAAFNLRAEQTRARAIAIDYWRGTKCIGEIPIRYRPQAYPTIAEAPHYINLVTGRYFNCAIVFNANRIAELPWPTYCAAMIHEYGHLDGKRHSRNPYSVMYPEMTPRNVPRVCKSPS